jgi:hypothetical protein
MASPESSAAYALHITPALFDRIITPLSRKKILVPLVLVLLILPVILLIGDGIFDQLHLLWRMLYVQPIIILYILILTPILQRANGDVIIGLRPIIQLTDEEFNQVVTEKSRIAPRSELAAIAIGLLIGILMNIGTSTGVHAPLTNTYKLITTILMYTGITWALYLAVASSRLTKEIFHQPIDVDIFDLRPFEPVGRESLMLSFAFIIGATIGMAFSITAELILTIESIIVYIVFALMTIVVFYANMIDTYRLLVDTKKKELNLAQDHISHAYRSFKQSAKEGEDIRTSMNDMNAWISMKERLVKTQTWPHTTVTVGRLLISSLMPAGLAGLRQLANTVLESITLPF